uniref:Protein translocase subunit SecA n=1 Tax=Membranoptera platyphylla TaxID=1204437 RepID=A0A1I9KQW1_9FLOR|nr:preprotein translocase subunit SecA [Membranoptera platyphylla]AMJ17016.1 preprotein translocase subunit SecA [Membranoptera platyphylla]
MFNFLSSNPIYKYKKVINQINNFDERLRKYNNIQLKNQTEILTSSLLKKDIDINSLLPEAFATAKEAIRRATGLILFDVQILGAIILHNGNITEMKTGEGKTIVAILPAYLNSLTKKGVHIITVNDYLAERDSKLAQEIFAYLNISIGLIIPNINYIDRKIQYQCDITYITNSELGFDYLRDNMAIDKNEIVQRTFQYAIVDEVDSILIDEARTPLIISGTAEINSDKYIKAKDISNYLTNKDHYEIDEKSKNIILSEKGIIACEKILNIKNLYNINNSWIKYIINALKAKELFIRNKEYILKNNQIIIVDEFTGRIMEGRRWSDGLHQAIEAKENLSIQAENKTLASITYQNLFLLYRKLCGMTGTAKTEEAEFYKIYKLMVIDIPTNEKCQRTDLPDLVYKSEYSKWQAIANECFDMYKLGRPTLIGTTNIEKSELLAKTLDKLNIPYNLLNAKPENTGREAEIISQAGQKYSITISTNMAGRGTDIILGGNPYAMTKMILTSYILQEDQTSRINDEINKYSEIKQLLNNINIDFFKKNIDLEKINLYIENIISQNILSKTEDKNNYNIYNKILNKYKKICEEEKKDILKLGGLYVIGTERHESRRIDNQLRGRSGRQGDQGTSRFFLSLQDNLFRIFGGEKIEQLMNTLKIDNNVPIESVVLSKSLNSAQKRVEGYFYEIRKQLFDYDEVINNQRQAIYTERKKILESTFTRDCIIEYGENTIDEMLYMSYKTSQDTKKKILQQIFQLLNIKINFNLNKLTDLDLIDIKVFLYEQLRVSYDLRESYLEQLRPGLIRKLEKYYLLQQIDQAWQEHLEKMTLLKEYIAWRSYGQQDPLIEYKNEAFNLFINMVTNIRQTVIYLIMRSRLIINT